MLVSSRVLLIESVEIDPQKDTRWCDWEGHPVGMNLQI